MKWSTRLRPMLMTGSEDWSIHRASEIIYAGRIRTFQVCWTCARSFSHRFSPIAHVRRPLSRRHSSPFPLGIFSFDPPSLSLSLSHSNLKLLSISGFCPSLQALALLHPLIYSSYQIHIAKRVRRATFHLHAAALQIRYTTLTRKMTGAPHAKSLCL